MHQPESNRSVRGLEPLCTRMDGLRPLNVNSNARYALLFQRLSVHFCRFYCIFFLSGSQDKPFHCKTLRATQPPYISSPCFLCLSFSHHQILFRQQLEQRRQLTSGADLIHFILRSALLRILTILFAADSRYPIHIFDFCQLLHCPGKQLPVLDRRFPGVIFRVSHDFPFPGCRPNRLF